ncbi:MAG: dockerin type I repeat-containing protein [Planctomycetota bacterium]
MKRRFMLPVLGLALACSPVLFGQQSLTIGSANLQGLQSANVDVFLTSTAPTEGYVLAIQYDTTQISVTSFTNLVMMAELVAPEIFDAQGGATLGVVLDASAPFAGQTIPPSVNLPIARATVMPDVMVAVDTPVAISFTDGTLNNPPLNNIIVQGGLSLGAGDISLNNGSVTLLVPPPATLSIGDIVINSNVSNVGCAPITLDNGSGPVQGFVLAIQDTAGLTLTAINIAGATVIAGAEFVVPNINNAANGGTLGVVLDFSAPFNGQTIPTGSAVIAEFCYRCDSPPVDPAPASVEALTFVDGVLGSPALDNVIVVAGLSISPILDNGSVTCLPVVPENTMFLCGEMDANGDIVDPTGNVGETVPFCFFYKDPDDNLSGFQLAVTFDCCLEFIEGTFTVEGTILDAVGAEFVNHNVDNDPNDGDGCEFVAGILLDALPPFDRQTVPPTAEPLKIGTIDVLITSACECDNCYLVEFTDGVDGRGTVAIENVVIVNTTESVQGFLTMPCNICVTAEKEFNRGDCNNDGKVNIADSATILAAQFQGFVVDCDDACDSNDDGKINLADSVYILTYQFKFGPPPPAPFDPAIDGMTGTDPTIDDPSGLHGELGCENGFDPCP